MTPRINEKYYLVGTLDLVTGTLHHGQESRNTHGLFRDLLQTLDDAYPAVQSERLHVVVDDYKLHQAKACNEWLVNRPRVTLLVWPTDGSRANPIEHTFGDGHDLCTHHLTRKRLPYLVAAVDAPLHMHGPWTYQLSALYGAPVVTAAVEKIARDEHSKVAA